VSSNDSVGVAAASVDVQRLERLESELGAGGRAMLADAIDAFFADFPQGLERLAAHADAAAWDRVAAEAHRLRSSTATLAATELSRSCQELEECARGEPRRAAELIQRLRDEFPRVRAALAAHARRPAPPLAETPPEPAPFTAPSESNRVSS
jgi:HPt (histidine-containing phosphotransfer) domain-containing protein